MKSYFKLTIGKSVFKTLLLFGLFSIPLSIFAQSGTITGTGTVDYADHMVSVNGRVIFTSHIIPPGGDPDDMLQLDAISLFRLGADLSGDLACQVKNEKGYAILSVYATNANPLSPDKGSLLYRLKATYNPQGDMGIVNPVSVPFGSSTIQSNQIKTLVQNAETWLVDPSTSCTAIGDWNLLQTTMAYINYQVNPIKLSPLDNCLKGNNYKLSQPVIVEVEAQDVTFHEEKGPEIKFPGQVEDFYLGDYFNEDRAIEVTVKVNGIAKQTYKAGNENPQPLNITLGDSVTYEVKHYGKIAPVIEGMPGVWIARFAGDLMYYCSPSVTPGEFNPWIGYDSRVHTLQLRNMKGSPGFKDKVSDWDYNPNNNSWTWGWYAQRQMNANKSKYEASYTWPKYKRLSNGSFQRNNQREGLNVQFLNYWQNGENSDFKVYQGRAKYMMGFDDDELLYLNSQYYDAINHPPGTDGGIAKLDSIPSRGMPEGYGLIYDVKTGYPAQGFPLNMVISAYRKNREWVINNKSYFKKYDGYEIQDIGTDDKNPDGRGSGNNTAPGIITIKAGGKRVTIRMNVKSPLTDIGNFYGSLEGNRWPAYSEKNISYTLTGLKGLSINELNGFSLEYEGSDALGNLVKQTKYLKDLPSSELKQIQVIGRWKTLFDNTYPTYSCITAYYQRTPETEKVIVAGKELKPIFLLFIGEKNLEGKGLGAKIWLNDFRENKTSEYSEPRNFGNKVKFMKPYVRVYTFPVNTTTTFQTWDGDPHLFYDSGIEWFLSSRTLAKRIPDNYLDGTNEKAEVPYLKYYIDDIEQTNGRSGKEFTYKWSAPGTYTLKVEYRTAGGLTTYKHKMNIVDYPVGSQGSEIGKVTARRLTSQEIQWLKVSDPSNYLLLEVADVYSSFEYKDGPRANNPYPNRWAEHSDYASEYEWSRTDKPSFVDDFIKHYNDLGWFWYDWALHYSSNWRDNKPYGLPDYVGNNQVTRVITTELDKFSTRLKNLFQPLTYAKWQYIVPLISYTDYQGNRMRTNPSCLYDLNAVWSNTTGAFSGNPTLPTDPSLIQAPDITDEQKGRQELYYDLKSGKKAIFKFTGSEPTNIMVYNVFGGKKTFICTYSYK
jgi:hypothetical protein